MKKINELKKIIENLDDGTEEINRFIDEITEFKIKSGGCYGITLLQLFEYMTSHEVLIPSRVLYTLNVIYKLGYIQALQDTKQQVYVLNEYERKNLKEKFHVIKTPSVKGQGGADTP